MANTRRMFVLGLLATGMAVAADAHAKGGRSGRRSGGSRPKRGGDSGGYAGNGGGDSGCGSRGGPGGPRDANGKCPGWKK